MRRFWRVAVTIAGVGMVFYLCIFASVYRADHQRISYIKDKVSAGEKEIEILHLPYESYIWTPTPNKGEIWDKRYKLFWRHSTECYAELCLGI